MAVGTLTLSSEVENQLDSLDVHLQTISDNLSAKADGLFDALDFGSVVDEVRTDTTYQVGLYGSLGQHQGTVIFTGSNFNAVGEDPITTSTVVNQISVLDAQGNSLLSFSGTISGLNTINEVFNATSVQFGDAALEALMAATGTLSVQIAGDAVSIDGTVNELTLYGRELDRAFEVTLVGDLTGSGDFLTADLVDAAGMTWSGTIDTVTVERIRYGSALSTTEVGRDTVLSITGLAFTGAKLQNFLDFGDLPGFSLESLVFAGDDVLTANVASGATLNGWAGNDRLTGGSAGDELSGAVGNDTLNGGASADTMRGGGGNDTYIVDSAGDVVVEATGAGSDLVKSSVTYALPSSFENLTLTGTANLNGSGNALANVLTGNAGANLLRGYAGADTLIGAAASDTLDGGTGADSMKGGGGSDAYMVDNAGDTVLESLGAGTDLVKSSIGYALGANLEKLTLTGSSAINGIGNGLGNILTGNGAANVLKGLGGDDKVVGALGADTLAGNAGNDTLGGGGGADKFLFDTALNATTNIDLILDFQHGLDKIRLDDDVFTAFGQGGTRSLTAGQFSAHIVYDQATGALSYDADGAGGAAAVQFARLGTTTHPALELLDVQLIG